MILNKIHFEDCRETMKRIPDNSIDSIVTDPPYELGFMGKAWDKTGIAYNVAMWRECLRVLKPGGYLLSFGGTRTYHRMAVAIEDAGFEIRDMIEWIYGSGFPKSLNIGKAVDKLQGNEREVNGVGKAGKGFNKVKGFGVNTTKNGEATTEWETSKGDSEFEGWGTALKPAHEPICMARKPLSEKSVSENCLKWGTGGINIDGSRVGEKEFTDEQWKNLYAGTRKNNNITNGNEVKNIVRELLPNAPSGRFPANLIHDNSEEVRACFPETKSVKGNQRIAEIKNQTRLNNSNQVQVNCEYTDEGNASRFFKSIIYTSKASNKDRGKDNNHPTVKPTELIRYLINLVTPTDGIVFDPFSGSGTTAKVCIKENRKYICSESNEEHFTNSIKRINAEVIQKTLFT